MTTTPAKLFLNEIENFLTRSGMTPSAFGRAAVGDPNFVADLRADREPRFRVVERVTTFMQSHEAANSERETAA